MVAPADTVMKNETTAEVENKSAVSNILSKLNKQGRLPARYPAHLAKLLKRSDILVRTGKAIRQLAVSHD